MFFMSEIWPSCKKLPFEIQRQKCNKRHHTSICEADSPKGPTETKSIGTSTMYVNSRTAGYCKQHELLLDNLVLEIKSKQELYSTPAVKVPISHSSWKKTSIYNQPEVMH